MSDKSMLIPVYSVRVVRDQGKLSAWATTGLLNRCRPKDQWLPHGTIVEHDELLKHTQLSVFVVSDNIPQWKDIEAKPSPWAVFATAYRDQRGTFFLLSLIHI